MCSLCLKVFVTYPPKSKKKLLGLLESHKDYRTTDCFIFLLRNIKKVFSDLEKYAFLSVLDWLLKLESFLKSCVCRKRLLAI